MSVIRMRAPLPAAPPDRLALHQNVPNPLNPVTVIGYELPQRSTIQLAIFDPRGRLVRLLRGGTEEAGRHQVRWDGLGDTGSRVPSGAYFCRVLSPGEGAGDTRPLLLLK